MQHLGAPMYRNKTVLHWDELPAHGVLQNQDLPFIVLTYR